MWIYYYLIYLSLNLQLHKFINETNIDEILVKLKEYIHIVWPNHKHNIENTLNHFGIIKMISM